jgi:anti-anti-sigma factor
LKVQVEKLGTTTLVAPQGRLDFAAAAAFQQCLEQALGGSGSAPAALLVDCAALEYVSSAGLRVFLLTARAAQRTGTPLALCALQPPVREVFELSGFIRLIPVHADRPVALAQLGAEAAPVGAHIAVTAEAAQLPRLMHFLQDFWAAARVPLPGALPFELALEEVFMNVVMHGTGPGGTTPVEVRLNVTDAGLVMTIEDGGRAFDPLTLPAPDVTAELHQRPVGGQGVHLVRRLMDTVSYQRLGMRNQLKLTKRLG